MSEAGNDGVSGLCGWPSRPRQAGLSLVELMVVTLLVAIAVGGVSLSLRGGLDSSLDREAQRVANVLEAARVQARSAGIAVVWTPSAAGYSLASPAPSGQPSTDAAPATPWLHPDLAVSVESRGQRQPALSLGIEPMMAPVTVRLVLGERELRVSTDGLRPFRVETGVP